jgi:hypothetical protein
MARPDVEIVNQSEYQKYGYGSNVQPTIRVSFKVGQQGPFTVDIPKAEYTAAKVWALIDPIADEIRQVNSKQPE